jgi:hypothetical protein
LLFSFFHFDWRLEVRRLLPKPGRPERLASPFWRGNGISEAQPLHAPLRGIRSADLVKDGRERPSHHLVRDHSLDFFEVRIAYQYGISKFLLAFLGLRGQDVAQKRFVPLDLSRPRFLEALGSAFVCF